VRILSSSAPVDATAPSGSGRLPLTLAVAAIVLVADQLTKAWAVNGLADGHDIDLFWTLRLHLTFNGGMAFSQGRGLGPVISIVALVVVVVLLASLRRRGSTVAAVAVGLVVGGAAGNVVDRLLRSGSGFLGGRVVDFIDPQWWPIFNVADASIVVGGALLLLFSYASARLSHP
jgi:signal peptidase II